MYKIFCFPHVRSIFQNIKVWWCSAPTKLLTGFEPLVEISGCGSENNRIWIARQMIRKCSFCLFPPTEFSLRGTKCNIWHLSPFLQEWKKNNRCFDQWNAATGVWENQVCFSGKIRPLTPFGFIGSYNLPWWDVSHEHLHWMMLCEWKFVD